MLENTDLYRILRTKEYQNRWGKLGNNTYAAADPSRGEVKIQYHGNTIANLHLVQNQGVVIHVSDAGWGGSPGIRARINQILDDNGIPAYACQRKNEQKLFWRKDRDNEKTAESLWSESRYGYSTVRYAHFARKYFTEIWEVIPR